MAVHTHAARLAGGVWEAFTGWERFLLFTGSVACYGAWYFSLRVAGLPVVPGYSTDVLTQSAALSMTALAIMLPVFSLAASLLVGRVRTEAGLVCALIGMVSLPVHGGDLRNALLDSGSPDVFARFAVEAVFFTAIIAFTYRLMMVMVSTGWMVAPAKASDKDPDTVGDRLIVVVAQAAVVLVIMMFLGQSPVKGQALIGVCAAGMLASMAIHQTYKVSESIWYILGTMLACVIANLYCWYNPVGIAIGDIRGLFAGPARSLPLHYATLGAAGTIYGYWLSLVWAANKAKIPETT